MANRFFVSTVVILWLSSMAWLVTERVLPSFLSGQPPLVETYETGKAVAWSVEWAGKRVGRAASMRLPGAAGTTDLRNRVILNKVPLLELAPAWMRVVVGEIGNIDLDATTRMEFDSLGNFSSFESRIALNDLPAILKMSGRVENSYLELKVSTGSISHTTPIYLPNSQALNESLFPEARITNLTIGDQWREEVYSPFRAPGNPVELLQAEVVSEELLTYLGKPRRVLCVEYRSMVGSGVPRSTGLRAVTWVDREGDVLRRDVYIGTSKLRFERLPVEEAAIVGLEMFEKLLPGSPNRVEPTSPVKKSVKL